MYDPELVSPIGGAVPELAVHTVGGVVTVAQPLLFVEPQYHLLEVEAQFRAEAIGSSLSGNWSK